MITHKELFDNGFVDDGEWNGRYYFTKNGFNIVSHCGISRWNKNNLSGYGKDYNTIEELNEAYKEWAMAQISKLEPQLEKLKQSLA
jgi:hypothetical protein